MLMFWLPLGIRSHGRASLERKKKTEYSSSDRSTSCCDSMAAVAVVMLAVTAWIGESEEEKEAHFHRHKRAPPPQHMWGGRRQKWRREVKERGGEDEKRCGSPNPAGRDRRGKEGKEEEWWGRERRGRWRWRTGKGRLGSGGGIMMRGEREGGGNKEMMKKWERRGERDGTATSKWDVLSRKKGIDLSYLLWIIFLLLWIITHIYSDCCEYILPTYHAAPAQDRMHRRKHAQTRICTSTRGDLHMNHFFQCLLRNQHHLSPESVPYSQHVLHQHEMHHVIRPTGCCPDFILQNVPTLKSEVPAVSFSFFFLNGFTRKE